MRFYGMTRSCNTTGNFIAMSVIPSNTFLSLKYETMKFSETDNRGKTVQPEKLRVRSSKRRPILGNYHNEYPTIARVRRTGQNQSQMV